MRHAVIRRALPASALLAAALLLSSRAAVAQTCDSVGPDVMIGDMSSTANFNVVGDIDAFSLSTAVCNIGNLPAVYAPGTNQTPLISQSLFRLQTLGGASRFEQIGKSWCYHTFFALSNSIWCAPCEPTDGFTLGVRCADITNAQLTGSQSAPIPSRQVNAATGFYPYPPANPPWSGTVARRLQVHLSDLDPARNPGAQYFAEHLVVSPDDAAAQNSANNATHRRVTITPSTPQAGYTMLVAGIAQRGRAAILAWRDADPDVTIVQISVPGDGICLVGGRATQVASTTWRYEYAVQNLTSDRSAGSFHVPLAPSVIVGDTGFHDVDYHSGDGEGNINFDGTDWPAVRTENSVSWSTTDFAVSPTANALRWGTLYNFRLDTNAAPVTGALTIGLFKPGVPASIDAPGLPVPGTPCAADWNNDGLLDSQDFFGFLDAFFAGTATADFNHDTFINSQDFFDFLAVFFAGC